jgi:hypothetical protein
MGYNFHESAHGFSWAVVHWVLCDAKLTPGVDHVGVQEEAVMIQYQWHRAVILVIVGSFQIKLNTPGAGSSGAEEDESFQPITIARV